LATFEHPMEVPPNARFMNEYIVHKLCLSTIFHNENESDYKLRVNVGVMKQEGNLDQNANTSFEENIQ